MEARSNVKAIIILSLIITAALGYNKLLGKGFRCFPSMSMKDTIKNNEISCGAEKPIFLTVNVKRRVPAEKILLQSPDTNIIAYESVYDDKPEGRVSLALKGPVSNMIAIVLNPMSMVFALYLSSIAWSKATFTQKILAIFGRGSLVRRSKKEQAILDSKPYQVFECDKCKMELRPAKGRAEIIFGRERFRCARCGSPASAYFDIANMSDPRAVARLIRLEQEAEQSKQEDYDDNVGDETPESEL